MSQTLPQPQSVPGQSGPSQPSGTPRASRRPHTVHPETVVAVLGAGPAGWLPRAGCWRAVSSPSSSRLPTGSAGNGTALPR